MRCYEVQASPNSFGVCVGVRSYTSPRSILPIVCDMAGDMAVSTAADKWHTKSDSLSAKRGNLEELMRRENHCPLCSAARPEPSEYIG